MIRYLKNLGHLLVATIALVYYRFPARNLIVIGVTGTSGKTTTAHLIYGILKQAELPVALISSIAAFIKENTYDTGFHVTTPSPFALQKFIRMAKDVGSKYLVLEVTSHALDQHRIFGIPIMVGVITNIAHEHLDYHKTLANYQATKSKLIKKVNYSVLNKDDKNFSFLAKRAGGKIITFALNEQADFTMMNTKIKPSIPGEFNLYNCLAAVAVANIFKVDKRVVLYAVSQFKGIAGRMEEVKSGKSFRIFIDFAHKPDALEQALKTARKLTVNKLIVIFGCAGLRDRLKRSIMGKIAAQLADYTILTAEDPRTEDVREIINQITVGCLQAKITERDKKSKDLKFIKNGKRYFWRIPDRQEAINFSIRKLAKEGDLILICGKGHEKSMCYGRVEYPWSEHKAIEKALYDTVKVAA